MKGTRTIAMALEPKEIHRGPLICVNKVHPLVTNISKNNLAEVAPGVCLEKQAARMYEAVIEEIGAESQILPVIPVSGYRSQMAQESLFADALLKYGEAHTNTYVALPGCSEHQTGLALDVAEKADAIDWITPSFPDRGTCRRFRETAVQYGFILRYPQGREKITGIGYEPWHFRYVGIPHAELITKFDFTLEEYLQWIKAFPWGRYPYRFESGERIAEIGYVPARGEAVELPYGDPYVISGNNMDGYVVAAWGGFF